MAGDLYPGSGYPGSYGGSGVSAFDYVGSLATLGVGLHSKIARARRRRVVGGDAEGVSWGPGTPLFPIEVAPKEFNWVGKLKVVGYQLVEDSTIEPVLLVGDAIGRLEVAGVDVVTPSDAAFRYCVAESQAESIVVRVSLCGAYGYEENVIGRDDEDLVAILDLLDLEESSVVGIGR